MEAAIPSASTPVEPLVLSPLREEDFARVQEIHQEGIDTGCATFDRHPVPDWTAWCNHRRPELGVVARLGTTVVGWAAASPVSRRRCYAGVVEASVYVAAAARGRGVGSKLLEALVQRCEGLGVWTVQAAVFAENRPSLELFLRRGFRLVGRRERIALMTFGPWEGRWMDTLLLERRSPG